MTRSEALRAELKQRVNTNASFSRDSIQEKIEDGVRVIDDVGKEQEALITLRPSTNWRRRSEGLPRKGYEY